MAACCCQSTHVAEPAIAHARTHAHAPTTASFPPPRAPPRVPSTAEHLWCIFKRCRELVVLPEVFFAAVYIFRHGAAATGRAACHSITRDACVLLGMKVHESLDTDLLEACDATKRAELQLCERLGWRLHPTTIFDVANASLGYESPLRLQRWLSLLAIVHEGEPAEEAVEALVDAIRRPGVPTRNPEACRVQRIAMLLDPADVVSTTPLVVAPQRDFVTAEPLTGRMRVDGGPCDGMVVLCAATPLGTHLFCAEDTRRRLLQQQRFLVFARM